jgi:hypothetical protein
VILGGGLAATLLYVSGKDMDVKNNFLVLLLLSFNLIQAQSMFLEKENNFAFDIGAGYAYNILDSYVEDFGSPTLYAGISFLRTIDFGFQYSTFIDSNKTKISLNYTTDIHFIKEPIGVASNIAFNKSEHRSTQLLVGFSLYKIIKDNALHFADKLIPIFSLGILLPNTTIYSVSFAIQYNIGNRLKIALTPGLNISEAVTQFFIGIEFIVC